MIVTLDPITPVGVTPGTIDWWKYAAGLDDACDVKIANYSPNALRLVIGGQSHWLEPWMANKFPATCLRSLNYSQQAISSVAALPAGSAASLIVTVSFGEEIPGIYPVPLYGTLPIDTLLGDLKPDTRFGAAGTTGLAADAGHQHPGDSYVAQVDTEYVLGGGVQYGYHQILTQLGTFLNDLVLLAQGPADIHLGRRAPFTATTVTLTANGVTTIQVADTSQLFATATVDIGANLGRTIQSIVDATHLIINGAAINVVNGDVVKLYSTGRLFMDMDTIVSAFNNIARAHGWQIQQQDGSLSIEFPSAGGRILLGGVLKGASGANSNLLMQMGSAAALLQLLNAANTAAIISVDNAGNVTILGKLTAVLGVGNDNVIHNHQISGVHGHGAHTHVLNIPNGVIANQVGLDAGGNLVTNGIATNDPSRVLAATPANASAGPTDNESAPHTHVG